MNKYHFQSDVFDIIIGGKSSIDAHSVFHVQNLEEADHFIKSYGYDTENPIEKAEVLGNFHEALAFIRKYFLQPEQPDGLKLEIPRKILETSDMRDLLLMSSMTYPSQTADTYGLLLRNWACSILKVMHTISHIDKDIRTSYFPDIQKQILDRYYKLIHRDTEGNLYLGEKDDDPHRVNLVALQTKPKKSRDSMILKLLHKPENVAEDIFDQVGIRFITYTTLDALRVIQYLKSKMVLVAANIKPSRSKNTLIPLDAFRSQLNEFLAQSNSSVELTQELLQQLAQKLEQAMQTPLKSGSENPHSSAYYKSIQFTCRQLIKLRNPLFDDLKELKSIAKTMSVPEELGKPIDRIDLAYLQREIRFFYPYEVQIVDQKSAEENEKGRSAHSEYKRAQVMTVLNRVMGSLTGLPGSTTDVTR